MKQEDDQTRDHEVGTKESLPPLFEQFDEIYPILAEWVDQWAEKQTAWTLYDMLALVRRTPDGERIPYLRVMNTNYEKIRSMYEARVLRFKGDMSADWETRSPLFDLDDNVGLKATFLAIERWCDGYRLYKASEVSDQQDDIELTLGLAPHGSSVRDRARDYSRLIRVIEALVQALPRSGETEEKETDVGQRDWIRFPGGISDLVECVTTGMPIDATDLGKVNIDGLTRTWALDLFDKMEEEGFERDLPVIERLRLFSQEADFLSYLPTPGLGNRIRRELETKPRAPVAEALRLEPSKISEYFSNEVVRHAQVLQGIGRYTALRVCHRSAYTVIRRNETKGKPIRIERQSHFDEWVGRGAIEFLSEVGVMASEGYVVDRFLADLDPRNGVPLDELKKLALEIGSRFENHNLVDHVYYHWTGGRGYHVVGEFKQGIVQRPEQVKRILEVMVHRLSDDVAIFGEDQPHLAEPFIVIDLKPVMQRGIYRNALSLHASTGGVSMPMTSEGLIQFDPNIHSTIDTVLNMLSYDLRPRLLDTDSYTEFVRVFSTIFVENH